MWGQIPLLPPWRGENKTSNTLRQRPAKERHPWVLGLEARVAQAMSNLNYRASSRSDLTERTGRDVIPFFKSSSY